MGVVGYVMLLVRVSRLLSCLRIVPLVTRLRSRDFDGDVVAERKGVRRVGEERGGPGETRGPS